MVQVFWLSSFLFADPFGCLPCTQCFLDPGCTFFSSLFPLFPLFPSFPTLHPRLAYRERDNSSPLAIHGCFFFLDHRLSLGSSFGLHLPLVFFSSTPPLPFSLSSIHSIFSTFPLSVQTGRLEAHIYLFFRNTVCKNKNSGIGRPTVWFLRRVLFIFLFVSNIMGSAIGRAAIVTIRI